MGHDDDGSWISPSDLADYTYCPRSYWYRHHPPSGGPSRASQRSARAGARFHDRVLAGERRRAEHGGAYWAALLVGLLVTLVGVWWLFHP